MFIAVVSELHCHKFFLRNLSTYASAASLMTVNNSEFNSVVSVDSWHITAALTIATDAAD